MVRALSCGSAACCAERLRLSDAIICYQPSSRSLEGYGFQAARRTRNAWTWPESQRLSAQRGGRAAESTKIIR